MALVPEENPYADGQVESTSGILYSSVLNGLYSLYPPEDLQSRVALSRTDGYWPFVKKGEEPPSDLTYGEFDFFFFADLLDRACAHFPPHDQSWKNKVFCDMGSGTGRLVYAAAALHPELQSCRGIELLQEIHETAVQHLDTCQVPGGGTDLVLPFCDSQSMSSQGLRMAPVDFLCGSMTDPYVYIGDVACIFCFSTCFTPELLADLAKAVGRQCRPGTLVITTDYTLPLNGYVGGSETDDRLPVGEYQLEIVETVKGWCWLTGGESTAYIHRVVKSLSHSYPGPLERPIPTLDDRCVDVVHALESGEMVHTRAFLAGVYNNMVMYRLPKRFYPRSIREEMEASSLDQQ